MMLLWLAYCTAVGVVIAGAASLAQRAALQLKWNVRPVWLCAMLLTAGVSAGSLLTSARAVDDTAKVGHAIAPYLASDAAAAAVEPESALTVSAAIRLVIEQAAQSLDALAGRLSRFDAFVVTGWAVLSLLLAALVLRAALESRRLRHHCESRHINGTHVLLTEDIGPAAVGLGVASVLLPRWALDLEDHLLDLVLRHEREHLNAKDPLLMLVGLGVLVLFPWQIALWWMWQRLRLAIELDCDKRLGLGEQTTARYAQLLMLLNQRLGRPAPAMRSFITVVAPLHPARSHLATRIRIMTQRNRRYAPLHVGLTLVGVLSATAFAYALPIPRATGSAPATAAVVAPSEQDTAKVYFEYQVTEPVKTLPGTAAPIYPVAEKAAGKEGEALAQFIVNKLGRPEVGSLKFLRKSKLPADGKRVSAPKAEGEYMAFENAVRDALPYMRFAPAKLNGEAVRQVVQMPFVFALAK
jgi:beta-lactamase regulating signal transducer with metallopeptidase domain